ncbi:MAG: thiamine phosphate synthase [Acidimicrobiales bacterium]|nr:thiamine phosphate synthase [Acidimicrobiales bacterium]
MSRIGTRSAAAVGAPSLPPIIAVTDRRRCAPRPLIDAAAAAVAEGARGIWLREPDLPDAERLSIARELARVLAPFGGMLFIGCHGEPPALSDLPRGLPLAIHLSSTAAFPTDGYFDREHGYFVGRSCHSLGDVLRAEREGCDYVAISPIFPSRSKPGYGPALGLAGLRQVCASTRLPVIALGGLKRRYELACRQAGAVSVAMLGAFMGEPDRDLGEGGER